LPLSGWDEKLDYVGDEIDIDAFIVSRRDKGKYFTNEAQVKPPETLALLLDTSGSVDTLIEEYLKSIFIISEALNYFHVKFSIFVFHSNYLYVVKPSYVAWDRTIAERLASLDSDGGTPLGNALMILEKFAPRYNFNHIIVITDGKPNDETRTHSVVHEMTSKGIRISFLGFVVKQKNFYNGFFKKMSAEGHDVSIINGLKSLPEAFFDLVSDVLELK
jgi:uncharacterized protein YegL